MEVHKEDDAESPDLDAWKLRVHAVDSSMHRLREQASEAGRPENAEGAHKHRLAGTFFRHRSPHPSS